MKVSKLRIFSIAIASLIITSSAAYAAMDMDSRVSQLEKQMSQVRTENPMGTYGANTANANPDLEDGYGWFFTADVLYWHAKVGGTEYAYSDQDAAATLPIKGRNKDISFDWDWGFRFGLGYNFDHDGWNIAAQYTYFDSNGSNSTTSGTNNSLVPLRGTSTISVSDVSTNTPLFKFATEAKSQFDFDYQALDLDLGRAYFISGNLSFQPHWGLKATWIDQKQTTKYTGGEYSATTVGLEGNTVRIKDESDFWGMGPSVGVNSNWYLGGGFSIFGNLGGSLVFGYFDVDHEESYTALPNNTVNLSANRHAFSPNMQMQLGLHYDRYINDNKQHIGVGVGFETNYWWRQNQMLKIDDAQTLKYERYAEDVSMHGLTIDVKWDF